MRILFLCYEFPPAGGGGGRALWHLCRQLADLGVTVDVLTSRGAEPGAAREGQARIYAVPTRRRGPHEAGPRAMVEFLWRARPVARRLMAEHRYDLLHYFFSVPTGLLSLALPRDVLYVVSLRGGDVPGYNPGEMEIAHAVLEPLNRRVWRRARAIAAVSDHLAEATLRIEPGLTIEVLPNGVDVELFQPPADPPEADPAAPVDLLSVCRLIECKGLQYVLDCLAGLRTERDWRLTVIGTGSYRQALERRSRDLRLDDRVEFTGFVAHQELPRRYGDAAAFLLPSYGDACPQTPIEAMACGLPVVATHASGVRHYVDDGVNGFLVEPRSAGALEAPLEALIDEPGLARRMGRASAEKAHARFSWRAVAERLLDFYRRNV